MIHKYYGSNTTIMATKTVLGEMAEYKLSDYSSHEKLEKFMEDVKNGIYPLTAFEPVAPPDNKKRYYCTFFIKSLARSSRIGYVSLSLIHNSSPHTCYTPRIYLTSYVTSRSDTVVT